MSNPASWSQPIYDDTSVIVRYGLYRSNLTHTSHSLPTKNWWEGFTHTTTSENWRMAKSRTLLAGLLHESGRRVLLFLYAVQSCPTPWASRVAIQHKKLESHEGSPIRTECKAKWNELETWLKTKSTTVYLWLCVKRNAVAWKSVFERLVAIIINITDRNIAFRRTVDELYNKSMTTFWAKLN
jgi:hypothetical protein